MAYQQRNPHQPHPMYGISQPFSIADLSISNNSGIVALTQVAIDTTSALISHGGNGIEINAQFGNGVTTCSIDITDATNNVIKTFNNVGKFAAEGLFVGYSDDGILLGGSPIHVRAYNFTGGGKVTIKVRKTS